MHLEYCRVLFSFHFMIMIKRAFKFETIVKTQDVTAKNLYRFFSFYLCSISIIYTTIKVMKVFSFYLLAIKSFSFLNTAFNVLITSSLIRGNKSKSKSKHSLHLGLIIKFITQSTLIRRDLCMITQLFDRKSFFFTKKKKSQIVFFLFTY